MYAGQESDRDRENKIEGQDREWEKKIEGQDRNWEENIEGHDYKKWDTFSQRDKTWNERENVHLTMWQDREFERKHTQNYVITQGMR